MKKLNYLLLGAGALLMASCANDDLKTPGTDGNFKITVNLPAEQGTRAGEETAMLLDYAVYDSQNQLVETGQETFTGTSTTFGINLLGGRDYTLLFFAQPKAGEGIYDFDAAAEGATLTVNYAEMNKAGSDDNNGGAFDCFYNTCPVSGGVASGVSVTLYRPVAQINWGTDDLTAPSVEKVFGTAGADMQATLSASVYSQLDLLSGELLGEKEPVTLGAFTAPDADFPAGSGYSYVAMQYVLAPATSALYDLNLNVSNTAGDATDVVVTSAPVQANYRTNIYGSLLTDNVNLTVELGDWDGDNEAPQGTPVSDGLYYENYTYTITNANGLKAYADIANSKAPADGGAMSKYTVILGADLDLADVAYVPFNNGGATFDGKGHTVSNLTVKITEGDGSAGFMTSAIGTVKNLYFKNADISGNFKVGVLAGDGDCAQITNVHVDGATLVSNPWKKDGTLYDDGNNCGGIVGFLAGEPTAFVENCSVTNATITAYRKVGGLVGYASTDGNASSTATIRNSSVSNTTITANQKISGDYDGAPKAYEVGIYAGGLANANCTEQGNTSSDVTTATISSTGEASYSGYINTSDGWLAYAKRFPTRPTAAQTIELMSDIDFGGATVYNFFFGGTFNGNGHTMSNMTITASDNYSIGLFNRDAVKLGLTVNDVNFKNINIDNGSRANGYVGVVCGDIQNSSTVNLNNVNVSNATLKGVQSVGGLVGFVASGCTVNVTDCSVSNSNFSNYAVADESGFVCGMVGRVVGTANFKSGNSVENVNINAYWTTKRGENSIADVAAPNASTVTITGLDGVTVKNVDITKTFFE